MKTLLQCRADRLFAEPACPLCHSHKVASYRCDEVTRHRDTESTPALIGSHTFASGVKAGISFYCGAELVVDENDRVTSHRPCTLAMRKAAEEIESEGKMLFDEQEEAA
ncbi:hypothetical protein [Rhizobium sp. PL01]|uniref:hypothetical protein n=1 Tax=Rhizobium sp. PL01 TaxID=3085631 RepID=UPI002981A25F|nr:hypothetical protein [Rhizobium sp. PL01]MDW5313758.1 hypothetical protein [Rhizobium sp. PL01]